MGAELGGLVRGFDTVTLAELERCARLQTRVDRKYFVGLDVLERLTTSLADEYRVLELHGETLLPYHSIYFDSPTLTTYRQHHQGRRKRFKCRTRLYVETGLCFFEVKLKDGRGRTVKRRLELDRSQHGCLTSEARAFLADELCRAFGSAAPDALAPTLETVYRRVTIACPEGRERVTCDVEVAFALPGGQSSRRLLPGLALVETKSARGDSLADRLLRRLGARPVGSCSKYCLGIALARGDVVDNLFRPVLRRHFEAAAAASTLAA